MWLDRRSRQRQKGVFLIVLSCQWCSSDAAGMQRIIQRRLTNLPLWSSVQTGIMLGLEVLSSLRTPFPHCNLFSPKIQCWFCVGVSPRVQKAFVCQVMLLTWRHSRSDLLLSPSLQSSADSLWFVPLSTLVLSLTKLELDPNSLILQKPEAVFTLNLIRVSGAANLNFKSVAQTWSEAVRHGLSMHWARFERWGRIWAVWAKLKYLNHFSMHFFNLLCPFQIKWVSGAVPATVGKRQVRPYSLSVGRSVFVARRKRGGWRELDTWIKFGVNTALDTTALTGGHGLTAGVTWVNLFRWPAGNLSCCGLQVVIYT